MAKYNNRVTCFFDKYRIKVLDDSKRCFKQFSSKFFTEYEDKNMFNYITELETAPEPLITIEIPLSKLEAISELEAIFYNNTENIYSRRMFEIWYEQQLEEKKLRRDYPSVQAAYEQYSMLLNLCGKGKDKFKNPD